MNDNIGRILKEVNGSGTHIVLTTGLLVAVITSLVGGSMWVGRLDQRIYDLEKASSVSLALAQEVSIESAQHVRTVDILQERQNQVLRHLDTVEAHLSAQDLRIDGLEINTAAVNRGENVRRPK